MTQYDSQAQEFLQRFGFTLKIIEGEAKCPPWDDHKAGCQHGTHYRIGMYRRITAEEKPLMTRVLHFDFWGSINDMMHGRALSPYDILACLGSEATFPTDADEVAAEFGNGDMKPSQAIAIARFARRLQRFFTEAEIEALSRIQ